MSDFPPIIDEKESLDPHALRDEESLLSYTQRIRLATVSKLTQHTIPDDPKDIAALNSVLDGIDRQEINKAKIEMDSQGSKDDQSAIDLIYAIANSLGNRNPYEAAEPVERTIEHEGAVIEGVELVKGELDSKPQQMNYDNFMSEYKKKNPKNAQDED